MSMGTYLRRWWRGERGVRPAQRADRHNFRPGLLALEGREVLSAVVINGVLVVQGSAGGDRITIRPNSSSPAAVVDVRIEDLNGVLRESVRSFARNSFGSVRVDAGSGNDTVTNLLPSPGTTTVFDELFGGDGDDVLTGSLGHSSLFGGSGNDTLTGGFGNDWLDGGAGNDRYIVAVSHGDDKIVESGFGGTDTLDYSQSSNGVWVDLHSTDGVPQPVTIGHTLLILDSLTSRESGTVMENVVGSFFDDTLAGNSLDNRIEGRGGNDYLMGMSGNDTYVFNAIAGRNGAFLSLGNDTIDELSSEGGADKLDYSGYHRGIQLKLESTFLQNVNGADGADAHRLTLADALGIENVVGTRFNDTVEGNGRNNTLWGRDGDDVLKGRSGDDMLRGERGSDIISGDEGNDLMFGDEGNDLLYGNGGHDILYGGNGNDTLAGGDGSDFLNGQNGNDILYGGTGNDVLYGWTGSDFLSGQDGNDRLYAGNDGRGWDGAVDQLYGGAGDDRFYELDWGPWVVDNTPDRTYWERYGP